MFKTILIGRPLRENEQEIVMEEGPAIATYSRKFYRLANDCLDDEGFVSSPLVLSISSESFHGVAMPAK